MKTEKQLRALLAELKRDDRLYYPAATVSENAPLALVQCTLEATINILEEILELPKSSFPLIKKPKT